MLGICRMWACRITWNLFFFPEEAIPHHLKIPQSTCRCIPDLFGKDSSPATVVLKVCLTDFIFSDNRAPHRPYWNLRICAKYPYPHYHLHTPSPSSKGSDSKDRRLCCQLQQAIVLQDMLNFSALSTLFPRGNQPPLNPQLDGIRDPRSIFFWSQRSANQQSLSAPVPPKLIAEIGKPLGWHAQSLSHWEPAKNRQWILVADGGSHCRRPYVCSLNSDILCGSSVDDHSTLSNPECKDTDFYMKERKKAWQKQWLWTHMHLVQKSSYILDSKIVGTLPSMRDWGNFLVQLLKGGRVWHMVCA